jgi:CheY-like chemotaxis protein
MSAKETLPVAILAESDDETRILVRTLLELLGFVVVEVPNAGELYDAAVCYGPDLILIELTPPVARHFSAIRRIKLEPDLARTAIIAVSPGTNTQNSHIALTAGCSAHLQKPLELDQLEGLIKSLIRCERPSLVSVLVH